MNRKDTIFILQRIICIFSGTLLLILLSTMVRANDLDLERRLQKNLIQSRILLIKIERALDAAAPYAEKLAELRALGESIRTDHRDMLLQLQERGARLKVRGAVAVARHEAVQDRYEHTISRYLAFLEAMDDSQVDLRVIRQLKDLLEEILPRKKQRIHGSLPYRHLDLPAQTPQYSPEVVPAYKGGNTAFGGADLAASSEAPISLPVAELAESLAWNPVRMYEWVKNNIRTEWYWGGMKGAEETLSQLSGNDADQAALLIALFRAGGFPARYVRGVIEFFPDIESAREQTELTDPARIARFFQKAGIPHETKIAGGRISNFRIEHVWVEVEIPYDNYRGAVVDTHGRTWVPLDTTIKAAGFVMNTPIDNLLDLDLGAMREEYLAGFNTETPLEYLAGRIDGQLSQSGSGLTYTDLLRTRTLQPEHMEIIPTGPQFKEIFVTGEYAELPEELRYWARFTAKIQDGTVFFDQTIPVHALSNRSIAVNYEPETIEDQEIMNAYGGLDLTPSYLIRLRPVLTVDGEREIVGKGGLAAGSDFSLTVELVGPAATERIENDLIAGYPTIIGLSAQQAMIPEAVAQENKNAERLLYERAMAYIDQGNRAEEELASLLQLSLARPMPTLVTLGGVLDVVSMLDAPHGFAWKGLYLDADMRIAEPVGGIAPAGKEPASLFMQFASMQNSLLENRVFEEGFGIDSVSTAKLLALAREGGIPVADLDSENVDTMLQALNLPDSIQADIANSVNQGYEVTIPETELLYEDWFGFAYLKENPTTHESGWMLSGEIAGGMTAWGLDRWPEYYKEHLENPYQDAPNTDPSSGYSIQKISTTDMQTAEVGTLLGRKLQVIVRDKDGIPVKGANVTFIVKAGGGNFANNSTVASTLTDFSGIAEVEYFLGKCTDTCNAPDGKPLPSGNPIYLFLAPEETFSTQIGENIIDASLDSGIHISTPFTHYGLPGEPVKMGVLPGATSAGYVLSWIGFIGVRVMDQYSNPVANVPVDFIAADPVEKNACPGNPNQDKRPALLIANDSSCMDGTPLYGQCGAGSTYGVLSNSMGEASIQVILGGMPDADYAITADAGNMAASTDIILSTYPFGTCAHYSYPWSRIIINSPYRMDGYGNIVNAAKVGSKLPMQAKVYWVMENEKLVGQDSYCDNGAFHCPETVVGTRDYAIVTDFDTESVTFDGQQADANGLGYDKIFDIMYEVGPEPGKKSVVIHADTKKQTRVNKDVCTDNCRVELETLNLYDDIMVDVFAVDIATDQEIMVPLDEDGYATCDVQIPFEILPAEYISASTTVVLKKDGIPVQYIQAERLGRGYATVARGFQFDRESIYTAQVVLNIGSDIVEIPSNEIPLIFNDISVDAVKIEDNLYPVPLGGWAIAIAETTPANRDVIWSAIDWDEGVKAAIDPQTGMITADADSASGWFTFRASDASVPCVYKDARLFIGCSTCASNYCVIPGKEFAELSSINFRLNLGKTDGGKSAGDIFIRSEYPSPSLSTPEELDLYSLQNADPVRDRQNNLVQVLADQALADIRVIDEYSYEIDFYRSSDVLPGKTAEGLYELADTAEPLVTWRVENPDAAPDIYNRLVISKLQADVVTKKYTYEWLADLKTWTLDKGDGAQVTSRETYTDPFTQDLIVTETIRNAAGEVASVTRKVYRTFPWAIELAGMSAGTDGSMTSTYISRSKLVEETVDPEGAALTTYTEYYDDTAPKGSIGRIKSVINPDGSWVRYEYDEQGRREAVISAWLDIPVTAEAPEARVVYYGYEPIDPADTNSPLDAKKPRIITEEVQGVVVARTYYAYLRSEDNSRTEIVEQAAAPSAIYRAPENLRTETVYYPSGTGLASSGKVARVLGEDGTLTTYSYEFGTYEAGTADSRGAFTPGMGKALRRTVVNGTASYPAGIAYKTTSETTIADRHGNTVERYSSVYTGSGYEPYQWTVHVLDDSGRPKQTFYSDGTFTETVWGCCAKESEIDRSGIAIRYVYDTMDRPAVTIREGMHGDITTTVTFDAAGRRLKQTVESQGLRQSTEKGYDTAGRLDYSIDAAGLMTDYDYDPSGLVTTATRPGGATEITTNYPDGRVRSITGSGVVSQYYEYGVNRDGSQWTKISIASPTSPRWEKITTDLLGRTVLSERPGYAGAMTSRNIYDDSGRLVSTETTGQAATIYEYDELGGQRRTGIDMDGNTHLDRASLDRITENETQYVLVGSDWWQEASQYVYPEKNDATRTRISTRRTRLSGFGGGLVSEAVSIDIHGNETVSRSILDRTNKSRMETVNFPDAANDQTSISEYGLLASTTSKSGLTVNYDYDALGRRTGITDPRTGRSSTHYDAQGRVDYVEDAAGYQTWFGYDPATGRKSWERDALRNYTRYRYNDRGQVTHVWGETLYPVYYSYDDYGQRTHMYTFRGGSGWDGQEWPDDTRTADVTVYHYDEATGLLTAKEDAAGRRVSYAYDAANRLATRTWARTSAGSPLSTTYVYDADTSELTDIDYSGSTVDVNFTYDRLGRQESVTDAAGSRIFSYNEALQLESESISGLYTTTIARTYATTGPVGRYTGLTVGPGYTVTYSYEPESGRFGSVSWNAGSSSGSVNYGYMPDSDLLQSLTFSTGQVTTYAYEPYRNLNTEVQNEYNGNLVSRYDYSYDDIGRRENVRNTGGAFIESGFTAYGYNNRNELTAAERYLGTDVTDTTRPVENENRGYIYDNIGNRTESSEWDATNDMLAQLTYTANQLNQYELITSDTSLPDEVPSYDDDGNMIGYEGRAYTYNGENRLVVVEPEMPTTGDIRTENIYDYKGRRVQKRVYTYDDASAGWVMIATSSFVYDGWNMIEELDETGQLSASYVWGLDLSQSLQGAGGIGGLVARIARGAAHTYTYDGNGNIGQMLGGAGEIAVHYEYDPYGNASKEVGSLADENPYRFSTKYFDTETDLYYYGYRYYMPELGRWLKRDPIGEQGGINLYGFVGNDPVVGVDRLGLALYAFDGTGQDSLKPEIRSYPAYSTNVWILYDIYGGWKSYQPGVGSFKGTKIVGGATGAGISNRLENAYSDFIHFYEDYGDEEVVIIGFSRGAASAREFANILANPEYKKFKGYKGCPVDILFVGLFDTVDKTIFSNLNLRLPERVHHASQAIAKDEKRKAFPLTRLRERHEFDERIFPGDHSDIGRGHGKDTSILSMAPLMYIYDEGRKVGVDFGPIPSYVYTYTLDRTPNDLSGEVPWVFWANEARNLE